LFLSNAYPHFVLFEFDRRERMPPLRRNERKNRRLRAHLASLMASKREPHFGGAAVTVCSLGKRNSRLGNGPAVAVASTESRVVNVALSWSLSEAVKNVSADFPSVSR
jgi:hypothetical protein